MVVQRPAGQAEGIGNKGIARTCVFPFETKPETDWLRALSCYWNLTLNGGHMRSRPGSCRCRSV